MNEEQIRLIAITAASEVVQIATKQNIAVTTELVALLSVIILEIQAQHSLDLTVIIKHLENRKAELTKKEEGKFAARHLEVFEKLLVGRPPKDEQPLQ